MTLPHGAVGWSAVCDCGISRTPDRDFRWFYHVIYFYLLSHIPVPALGKDKSEQPHAGRTSTRDVVVMLK